MGRGRTGRHDSDPYVVRGIDPEIGEATLFEQTAYAEVEDGAISAVRVACSGERPAA